MAAIDPELERHRRTWIGFTWFIKISILVIVITLGGMALFLAAIGLYAVMAYAVSQSTRELGLRMALGAGAGDLLRLVMSRGLILTASGIVLGAVAALTLGIGLNAAVFTMLKSIALTPLGGVEDSAGRTSTPCR